MTRVFLLWWIFIWVESGFERGWKKVGQVKLCLIIIITTATATMYHHQGTFVRRKKEKKCTTSYDRHHHQNSVLFWSSITFFPFCVKSEIALFLRICSKLLVLIISRKEDREKGSVGKKIYCWLLKRRKKYVGILIIILLSYHQIKKILPTTWTYLSIFIYCLCSSCLGKEFGIKRKKVR